MYSVYLVEDEIAAREGIRDSIPWEKTPYIFAGEAPDGEMALPALRDIKPDILITDIKMPFMDGLALARIIRKDQPWIKIIILSGHDEFQYAREAISIGVEEYLLKPISSEEMIKSLDKVTRQIEEERQLYTRIEDLEMKVRSHKEIIREKLLCELVTGQTEEDNVIETMQAVGIDLIPGGYLVMIIELASDPEDWKQYAKARTVLASVVNDREDVIRFSHSVDKEILLVKEMGRHSLDDTAYPLAQAAKFEIERHTTCRVSIGIGSVVDYASEIKHSYTCAYRAIRYMGQLMQQSIIGADDIMAGETDASGSQESITRIRTKHHDMIHRAQAYIHENYKNQDISLHAAASFVCMSPNHFSTIFSQEVGSTFIEYLTHVRIRRAKQLLAGSDMKCAEIAYEAGYNDPHYFSFIFKKHTGLSPRAYRASRR